MDTKIICLCGSTRFKDQFNDANFWLTINNVIVLSVGTFLHSDSDPEIKDVIQSHKEDLDKLHKRKIDLADSIMVIDVDGYIGESTYSEVEYAKQQNKTIYSYTLSKGRDSNLSKLVSVMGYNKTMKEAISPTGLSLSSLACPFCGNKYDNIEELEYCVTGHCENNSKTASQIIVLLWLEQSGNKTTEPLPEKGETISMARAMEMVRHYQRLEQRIRDRIKELEKESEECNDVWYGAQIDDKIDELRKLLQ